MWVERQIEGDRVARMRLDQAPWSAAKLARKGAKQAAWAGDRPVHRLQLRRLFHADPRARPGAARLRRVGLERLLDPVLRRRHLRQRRLSARADVQVHVSVRALPERAHRQGFADHHLRLGARRSRAVRARARPAPAAQGLGDCVDCTLCVQVCPTGIDIRNGLQNECIGCAACIDVCDGVMDRMGYAKRTHPLLHRKRRAPRLDAAADVQARLATRAC